LTLELRLERPLPAWIPVGVSTAVFCVGSCFHPSEPIERLELLVDGIPHPASAYGMPRQDVAAAHGGSPVSVFSGFWATVPIPARTRSGVTTLDVVATLASGRVEAPLGQIEAREPDVASGIEATRRPGVIAVCMATFEPDEALFRIQVESLRAQTDDRWICVISDDCSRQESFAQIVEVVGDDERFTIDRSEQRLGFYRNFERTLTLVPAGIELVALCDQDDRWAPDKLGTLRGAIGDAVAVYSDLRLVEADGRVLRQTFWEGRRNNHDNLASMVIANTITGAASLFRRDLIDLALPFPDTPGFQFHDHWLAVIALAAGPVAYVDRPLYDYVQHPGAVFGDVTHGTGPRGPRPLWRAGYFFGYLSRESQAQVALIRCAGRLTPRKRRALEWFIACDTSWLALLWLLGRPLRALFGHTETLGTELELAQGVVWKRLMALRARYWRGRLGVLTDASIPPPQAFVQKRLRRWRARV
jgi:Glycosyl transferase family 2